MGHRRSDQGQTLPLVSLCLVTLMVAAALSVDIGALAVTNRRLQSVADLAAIDGARELTGAACIVGTLSQQDQVNAAVVASAARNKFLAGGDKTMVVELGTINRNGAGVPSFTPLTGCTNATFPDAVQVGTGDRTAFSFGRVIGMNGRTSSRSGFASKGTALVGDGAFSLGSALATVSTDRATLLNPILNQMLCPGATTCAMTLYAASYQGLVNSQITYGKLAAQLGFATTSELFSSNVAVGSIFSAAAAILDPNAAATVSATSALGTISGAITGSQQIKLGDMVSTDLLTGNAAAKVGLNVFDLLTGTAAIANGTNAVSLSNVGFTVPGVTSIGVSFALIEAPVTIGKTPGATRTTKQLTLTLTPQVSLSTGTLVGLDLATVSGALTIGITGGKATGTLTGVRCGASKGIDVNVVPTAAAITTSGTLNLTLSTSGANGGVLKTLGGLVGTVVGGDIISTTLAVNGTGASTTTPAAGYDRSFAYPAGFGPAGSAHVGNTTVGFGNLTYGTASLNMSVRLLSLLGIISLGVPVNTTVNSAAISSLLQPVTSQIDTLVVQPLMESLGLDLGAADITATSLDCGTPRLG